MGGLRRNLAANFLGRLWAGMLSLALVPVYVRLLGVEAYGLVSVFVTLRMLFSVLDLGLTTTLNRELARAAAEGRSADQTRDVVRTLQRLYAGICGVMLVVSALAAPAIAGGWIRAQGLSVASTRQALWLMGISIAFDWLSLFYAGGLQGLERQVLQNVILFVVATLRYGGAALVLFLGPRTVAAFFLWHAGVSVFAAGLSGGVLWRVLPPGSRSARFDSGVLRAVGRLAAGLSAVSLTGLLVSHLDRIVLSRLVPLSEFGLYGLAATAGAALYGLINPVAAAVFPGLAGFVVLGDEDGLRRRYHAGCQAMSVAVLPAALTLVLFSRELAEAWLRDPATTARVYPLMAIMSVSVALNGVLTVPYALQLARGRTDIALWTHVVAIAVLTPVTWAAASNYGLLGASLGWLVFNATNVGVGVVVTHRLLLRGETGRWLREDVGAPVAAAGVVLAAARMLAAGVGSGPSRVALAGVGCALAIAAAAWSAPWVRQQILANWWVRRGRGIWTG